MKFHPNGTLYASIATDGPTKSFLGIINVGTGSVTPVGPTISGLDGLAIGSVVVPAPGTTPVPSSWLLVSLGIGCIVLFQLVKRARKA